METSCQEWEGFEHARRRFFSEADVVLPLPLDAARQDELLLPMDFWRPKDKTAKKEKPAEANNLLSVGAASRSSDVIQRKITPWEDMLKDLGIGEDKGEDDEERKDLRPRAHPGLVMIGEGTISFLPAGSLVLGRNLRFVV